MPKPVLVLAPLAVVGLLTSRVVAQSPPTPATVRFEAASVKKSADSGLPWSGTGLRDNRWTATNASLRTLIRSAYGPLRYVAPDQITPGPSWMDAERFDIVAVAEGRPTRSEFAEMARQLLEERFKLEVHEETRDLAGFALVLARDDGRLGPSLRSVSVDCASYREAFERGEPRPDGPFTPGVPRTCDTLQASGPDGMLLSGRAVEMAELAQLLVNALGSPVVDRTGLTGTLDFDLRYTPDSSLQAGATDLPADRPPALRTALSEQLGLRIESARVPAPVLVIDRAERPVED
jgi:uncharacterized protein (TIGR03435 family)